MTKAASCYFEEYLSRRRAEGRVRGRHLFHEIELRAYTGSFSNLEYLLAKWPEPLQCLYRRIPDKQILIHQVAAWEVDRNAHHAKADWQFTTDDARITLKHLYPTF